MKPLKLTIEGMHCDGCVTRVTKGLSKMAGVKAWKVEVGSADVQYDSELVEPASIVDVIEKMGFVPRVVEA